MATVSASPVSAAHQAPSGHSSHPFTCNTCQVAFRSSELQRAHMQTDWHRYNLKRRVASLPPLSSEIFTEKVLANKASAAATAAKATYEKYCTPCQKTYYSENAFLNHLHSQKHKSNAQRRPAQPDAEKQDDEVRSITSSAFSLGDPIDTVSSPVERAQSKADLDTVVESMQKTNINGAQNGPSTSRTPTADSSAEAADEEDDSESEEPPVKCLFCNYASPRFELNVSHMQKIHGMFIPEKEYLVDLEGLVLHLQRKIHKAHMCLYCEKAKFSAAAAQTHMLDKGHCMIAFSSEDEMLEIGQFYDFRSTYSDGEDEESESDDDNDKPTGSRKRFSASKLGARRSAGTEEDGRDEGWETDSSVSSVPSDEIGPVPIDDFSHRYAQLSKHKHHSHNDRRSHLHRDGFHSHAHATPQAVFHDDFEMHLPSGRTAGHRSLKVFYSQNLRRHPDTIKRLGREGRLIEGVSSDEDSDQEQSVSAGNEARGHDRGRQVVSRGNLGMIGVTDAKKKEVTKSEQRERKNQLRAQERQRWGTERRNNNQKHFRDPLLQ